MRGVKRKTQGGRTWPYSVHSTVALNISLKLIHSFGPEKKMKQNVFEHGVGLDSGDTLLISSGPALSESMSD